jgi:hypothetical protein
MLLLVGLSLSLTIAEATKLIEKMVSNQGWSDDRLQPCQRGTHTVKEEDMLHTKMDLLMKRMDALTSEKAAMAITTQAMDARMTCEVCGDTGHSRNYCPATQEDVMYMNDNNNGYRPQGGQTWNQSHPYYQVGNQGNGYNPNQPSLKDLVFGQAKINDGFNKKTTAYDKALESLNVKIDNLSYALKNQLSFNKMIEIQLAQLAALVPSTEDEKILGQLVSSCENFCAMSTRWGKSSGRARAAD